MYECVAASVIKTVLAKQFKEGPIQCPLYMLHWKILTQVILPAKCPYETIGDMLLTLEVSKIKKKFVCYIVL